MAPLTTTLAERRQTILFPRGGWDTHHHIFERITKSVLTHGLSYGDDCTSLKAFMSQLGSQKTRAIGVINPEKTSDGEMLAMHKAGVRGVRVNLYQYNAMEDVELQKVALLAHLKRIIDLSLPWSLTMTTTRTDFWDILEPFVRNVITKPGTKLVTDHFALLKTPSLLPAEYRDNPTKQPGFDAIMRLVRDGHLWVKLSAPYRISEKKPAYSDAKYLVRAFFDANKYQILWGSDWPHTPRMKVRTHEAAMKETPYLEVDDAAWLKSLKSWLSDEEWDLMMIQNPSRLFGQCQDDDIGHAERSTITE
ncbi:hypothetical protein ColTof4_07356 [Colletotrichum tofieldiae]|nr:hypothetical protein ColTof3_12301 [Colletotrichum tofieldiae]GKT74933.1 hypothetical protein ColTof4_07356 [Colletotrichum tofieldiae]